MRRRATLLALLLSLPGHAVRAGEPESSHLTVYGGGPGHGAGTAVVRQVREIDLAAGHNRVRFTDVAGQIDPTTVSFRSLTDPEGTRVIEQDFQYDLVNTARLLSRFVDREVEVEQVRADHVETYRGTLLSASGGLVLRLRDGAVRTFEAGSPVLLPSLPGGLITRPTLVWEVEAGRAGVHRAEVAYQTAGIGWWADYNLTLADGAGDACTMDLGAWVTVKNESGTAYPQAHLKLVAGEVARQGPVVRALPAAPLLLGKAAAHPGFDEQAFFEYHLYTLRTATTIPDNSTKQIELFPRAAGVSCQRLLVFAGQAGGVVPAQPVTERAYGADARPRVDVQLRFANSVANGLGMPLPAGRMRVSQRDPADGALEFVGEDGIGHTARDETVTLRLGAAFDVVGERRQADFQVNSARRTMQETVEIRLRNRKAQAVHVQAVETMNRWVNWEIVASTIAAQRRDARTVEFPVDVPAGGETVLSYTVRYNW